MSTEVRIFTEVEDDDGGTQIIELNPEASKFVLLEDYQNLEQDFNDSERRRALYSEFFRNKTAALKESIADLERHNHRYMIIEQRVRKLLKGHQYRHPAGQTISGDLAQRVFELLNWEPPQASEQQYSPASPRPKHFEPVAQGSFSGTAQMYPASDDGLIIRD